MFVERAQCNADIWVTGVVSIAIQAFVCKLKVYYSKERKYVYPAAGNDADEMWYKRINI